MLLRRFYDEKLSQASYLIGCQATGEALVVDPNRDTRQYMEAAEREEVTLRYVSETHIHADYVSGSRELAHRSGATLLLPGDGPPDGRYAFADNAGARLVRDGDEVEMGRVRVRVLHTPGHTPEHISFMITDGDASLEPMGLLTGDFLFVGDVGRPDLLEDGAGVPARAEERARTLYGTLGRFRALPPWLQVLPGHGAGMATGQAVGAVPTSTLGYEQLANWAFRCGTEEEFIDAVLRDQREIPAYFAHVKRMNREGPPILPALPNPRRMDPTALAGVLASRSLVVDIRDRHRFAAGHVSGTLNIPLNRSFPNWGGWLLPYERPVYFVADGAEGAREAARDLSLIGIDGTVGFFDGEALVHSAATQGALQRIPVLGWEAAEEAVDEEDAVLLDVRNLTEWNEGRAPGAIHIHLGYLGDRVRELPRERPVLAYCRSGARSAIAASLLRAAGLRDVRNVEGGILERERLGLPVAR